MRMYSASFEHNQPIPRKHTGDGDDRSPVLSWDGAPHGTQEFALILDDPDAPTREPWVHWLIYGIPADAGGLPEGIPRHRALDSPRGARQGRNTWNHDNIGYRGPAPPRGHGTHHYHFRLYALDAPVSLEAGADKRLLLDAMQGHILAQTELIGTYER